MANVGFALWRYTFGIVWPALALTKRENTVMLISNDNATPKLGVVVIGRNEGERLRSCLTSILPYGYPLVYVDSGSTDDSMVIASSLGVKSLLLDTSKPFSAARARNEGFEYLTHTYPSVQYIQFIDGDCYVCDGWFEHATATLDANANRGAVVGHLLERHPEASVYNRLCALEWKSPVGDMANFGALGGISVMRVDVFKQLGGFRPDVIAGEDSELGVRMCLKGYQVVKIDHNMATHDANMTRFSQWWKRNVRAGHAIGQRALLNGQSAVKDCVREQKSTLFWGVFLPIFILILLVPSKGLSLLLLSAYVLLGFKIFKYRIKQGESASDGLIYTFFTVVGKFANAVGLLKFYKNNLKNQYHIIEYK
jgi:glycosyltransferase involved in cell wall biosynthesis